MQETGARVRRCTCMEQGRGRRVRIEYAESTFIYFFISFANFVLHEEIFGLVDFGGQICAAT